MDQWEDVAGALAMVDVLTAFAAWSHSGSGATCRPSFQRAHVVSTAI